MVVEQVSIEYVCKSERVEIIWLCVREVMKGYEPVRIASELHVKHSPVAPLPPAEREQGVTSIFTKYAIR